MRLTFAWTRSCMNTWGQTQTFKSLWDKVVRNLLLLSHGQATVERGFSFNKQIKVENLHERSFITQQIVDDHIKNKGGALFVPKTKDVSLSAAAARQRYMGFLDEQKRKEKKEMKRKGTMDELEQLREKKKNHG